MALIAILDDEPEIRRLLADALEASDFQTTRFGRATEFEAALASQVPDLCLIDLSLPDRDGLALVARLSTQEICPVIIISGRSQVQDRITGLELGADDYIIKPFDPAEVVARVRASLRRGKTEAVTGETARFGDWTADFNLYELQRTNAAPNALSRAEGDVLRLFLESPNRLVTRDQMQAALGNRASDAFDRAMDVRISRLRTKLGEDPKNPKLIKTIYGAGYIFVGQVDWSMS